MKLIVGLGNPGDRYEKTRHNIGFLAMERLCEKMKWGGFRNESKFKAEVCRGETKEEKVILVKPQTFMNLSGETIHLLKQFYKVDAGDIWVVYDDVDLPLGTLRIREEGSAGTHNGMKSILQALGTEAFPRFRLGIENRGNSASIQQDTASFVLEPFRHEEYPEVNQLLDKSTEALQLALLKGIHEAQKAFSQ